MVERAQLPGPVSTGEKRGSGRKTRSQEAPAETEALMQLSAEGHVKLAVSYGIAAVHVRVARNGTQDPMARRVLYHTAQRLSDRSDWHMDRAVALKKRGPHAPPDILNRRPHAEKTKP